MQKQTGGKCRRHGKIALNQNQRYEPKDKNKDRSTSVCAGNGLIGKRIRTRLVSLQPLQSGIHDAARSGTHRCTTDLPRSTDVAELGSESLPSTTRWPRNYYAAVIDLLRALRAS